MKVQQDQVDRKPKLCDFNRAQAGMIGTIVTALALVTLASLSAGGVLGSAPLSYYMAAGLAVGSIASLIATAVLYAMSGKAPSGPASPIAWT